MSIDHQQLLAYANQNPKYRHLDKKVEKINEKIDLLKSQARQALHRIARENMLADKADSEFYDVCDEDEERAQEWCIIEEEAIDRALALCCYAARCNHKRLAMQKSLGKAIVERSRLRELIQAQYQLEQSERS